MNILSCINTKYTSPLVVLLYSLRKYHPKGDVNLYVLSTKLSKKAQKFLKRHCEILNINLFIKIVKLKNLSGTRAFSVDVFLRVFAFDILPTNVEKILYVDADMLFFQNVEKLYNIDISNYKLACVLDRGTFAEHCKKLNINHPYFNTGMLLMNLKNIRKEWTSNKIYEVIKKAGKELFLPDQDTLNIITNKDDILYLDKKYNYQPESRQSQVDTTQIVLLHYVGHPKPWKARKLYPFEEPFKEIANSAQIKIHRKII